MSEKISPFHIALLVYMIELDVTFFSLPRLIAENIGTNGWIGLIGLSLIAGLNIVLIQLVYRFAKGRTVYEIMERAIPKWIMYPVYVLLAVFWVMLGSFVAKKFVLIFQIISFQTAPSMFLYSLIAVMALYLLTKGIYNISKAVTIFFFFLIPVAFLAVYFIPEWEPIRFTTFLFREAAEGHSFRNWLEVYTIFTGYELVLLLFPYADRSKKIFKGVYIGHFLLTSMYLLLTAVCFGFYSLGQLQSLMYPVIDLLSYIELPFINRIENLILTLFLFANLVSLTMFLWAALTALKRLFPKPKKNALEIGLVVLSALIAIYPKITRDSEALLRAALYAETGLAFAVPILLLLLLAWQNRPKGGRSA
ncbi:GerAB/ArcD/ProY family transporter [Paenibacillus mendelii]|uniref:GerAB/ArcD/ProY family transporter n=1 Tax=Paenibacillus mendelii TaxID=206163 RepID=A0ABV6JBW1_9BACL|nr:GerAB/ArcD/ProY family transporter [Paenibacillus mendelii]MCQ6562627.1 spore germination protein [Paenibacillus mendelii]